MSTYAKFTENNEWEGEEWHFYIPIEGNEGALRELLDALESIGGEEEDSKYELDLTPIPENEVDILVKHTDSGYMDCHNKLSGVLTFKPDTLEDLKGTDKDPFYKGEIREFMKEVPA